MPSWDTLAIVESLVAHVTGWSVGFPAESSGVAESHTTCCSMTVTDSGLTATDATGAGGGGGGGGGGADWFAVSVPEPPTFVIRVHVRQKYREQQRYVLRT